MIISEVAAKVQSIADENLKTDKGNKAESEKYLDCVSIRTWYSAGFLLQG